MDRLKYSLIKKLYAHHTVMLPGYFVLVSRLKYSLMKKYDEMVFKSLLLTLNILTLLLVYRQIEALCPRYFALIILTYII